MTSVDNVDNTWYKRSVLYEVVVRGFYDSDGDGTGDIKGVIEKLDYLQWLGVDCLWLLPFYDSPLRDGGYDVKDYYSVLPAYGTVDDVRTLVDEAHQRGMRILADMVMNHTSDQHAWFQESASSRDNPKADWYVWTDDNTRYSDAPIIFSGSESSNWEWHPERRQYYWHRYFRHQPDLNFENPEVQAAMLEVVRFWLDIGIDALRLDAIPQLFEEEGTNCNGIPATHVFLKYLRAEVEKTHPGRALLAEADGPPEEVVAYFGEGDECQMAFHFPIMPQMYMSVGREQRFPITEILARTPEIPENCQWGLFLRNHDELALGQQTPEEVDYMFAEYAKDPRMRINTEPGGNNGIVRRLLPLLDNDRRLAELMNAMIFSFKGTPVLYYGDEIGMGDNIFLSDRDGVRTPMQWSPDRNGGFSTADFAQLYLPPLMDSVFGYQAVNVESQLRNSSSLLHWMKRLLEVRKQHPLFGTGSFDVVATPNPAILAYLREEGDDVILCVNNLSRFAQPAELMLAEFAGYTPVELLGRVPFPAIGDQEYLLTMAPYQFYWFQLVKGNAVQ